MTGYRVVEGRSIEDVKAGEFIALARPRENPARVVARDLNCLWIRWPNGEEGVVNSVSLFKDDGYQIVEPIPEPEIKEIVRDLRFGIGQYEEFLTCKLTVTDGKITAVELVKEE